MRIGIDCHNLEGQRTGVGRYIWNLLKQWHRSDSIPYTHDREYMVEFFLYFKKEIPEDVYELVSRTTSPPPAFGGGRASRTSEVLGVNSNAFFKHWALPRAAARDKIDVLFCPDYVLPFCMGVTKFRIKTAVAIHDIIYEARPSEYSWPSRADKVLLKWPSKKSAKKADIIFVPSEFTKSEILKYYKIDPEKVVITPLAPDPIFRPFAHDREDMVEDEFFPPAAGAERARGVWDGISKKYNVVYKKYIFFVGSIFNRRFLPEKIQGFIEFAKNYSDFPPYGGSPVGRQFLIIGRNHTKPYQDIARYISDANNEVGREAIVWREHISDEELVYLYNAAFATLWLSSYEGFGLPVLESMACGTPVITCRTGSLPEVAGEAALYVKNPKDPQEIASVLDHLTRDREHYARLVKNGLLQAQKFSWQKTAHETIQKIMLL